jgi:hypothetical protein
MNVTNCLFTENRLLVLIKERVQNAHSGLQLVNIKQARQMRLHAKEVDLIFPFSCQDPTWMSTFNPVYGGVPRLWRLTKSDGADGIEEVVAAIQGIICKKDLPPFMERIR